MFSHYSPLSACGEYRTRAETPISRIPIIHGCSRLRSRTPSKCVGQTTTIRLVVVTAKAVSMRVDTERVKAVGDTDPASVALGESCQPGICGYAGVSEIDSSFGMPSFAGG